MDYTPDITPDQDDYQFAADDALMQSGMYHMTAMYHGKKVERWYDADRGQIVFEGALTLSAIETDYLPEALAAEIKALSPEVLASEVYFVTIGTRDLSGEQFYGVDLSDTEQNTAAAHLSQCGEEFAADIVSYWQSGDTSGSDKCFGWAQPMRTWTEHTEQIEECLPRVGAALAIARKLSALAVENFQGDCDYIGTDEWVAERMESHNASNAIGTLDLANKSWADKVEQVQALQGRYIALKTLVDECSDAAGGCEPFIYGDPCGEHWFLSYFGANLGRSQVVGIFRNADLCKFVTWGSPAPGWLGRETDDGHYESLAEDSHWVYAEMLSMFIESMDGDD